MNTAKNVGTLYTAKNSAIQEQFISKKLGGSGKPHKAYSLTVTKNSLSGPSHPPKVKYSGSEGTEDVSIKAGLPGPAHPPKTTGENSNNTFACDALKDNGNEEDSFNNKKCRC